MNEYVYDIEIYPNLFMITYIPLKAKQEYIDAYIKIDTKMLALESKNKISTEEYTKLLEDKQVLIKAIGIRIFTIWRCPTGGKDFINDLPLIVLFHKQHKILWGYNSNNYDMTMLDVILFNSRYVRPDGFCTKTNSHITNHMYGQSQSCIEYGTGYGRFLKFDKYYKRPFRDLDIQKILYLDKTFTALKQVAICLKWYRIQDLPIHFESVIDKNELSIIKDYNINDVLVTRELIRNQQKEIDLREDLSSVYDIDLRNLSRSSIGKRLGIQIYCQEAGIEYSDLKDAGTDRYKIGVRGLIIAKIKFQTEVLSNFLNKIKKQVLVVGSNSDVYKFKHNLIFANKSYTLAKGGLHSVDYAGIFEPKDDEIIIDADVTSYYPNGIIKFNICPAHLNPTAFKNTVIRVTSDRTEFKQQGGKFFKALKLIDKLHEKYEDIKKYANIFTTKAEGLKIAINRMYGSFNDKLDPFYDPKCTYQTTINLQLSLMMLIEDLHLNGIETISANTDGIVCRVKKKDIDLYKQICNRWEEYFEFQLEYVQYEKYLRRDVNNYIAIKEGYADKIKTATTDSEIEEILDSYVKRKGLFIEETAFNKGYDSPVVAKAIVKFCLFNVPYEDTIYNHINTDPYAIYDYCISQKVDRKFKVVFRYVDNGELKSETLQKSNRYYISDKSVGGSIVKIDGSKELKLVAGFAVTPFNNFVESDDYKIDYSYYLSECAKIIYGRKKSIKIKDVGIINLQSKLEL